MPSRDFITMKRVLLAAACGLCLPVHAEMTEASCATSWGLLSIPLGLGPDLATPRLEGEACVARDLEIVNGRMRVVVDELHWQLDGLEALLIRGALLDRVEIRARGVYVLANTGMADFDYVMEAQARASGGIAVDLLATHDAGELRLDRLHVDFPGENSIDATLHMTGVDPAAPEAARIHAARIEVLTRGLFESYALMPLANLLLAASEDPETEVARLQAGATAAIEALPEPLFHRSTRQALAALVADMPNPAGIVVLDLQSPAGLPLSQFTEEAGLLVRLPVTDPVELLEGATLQISYHRYGVE
jgi:hypothetical protein